MKLELIHIYDYELVNENDEIIGVIHYKQDAEEIVRRVNEYEKIPELLEKQELRESACRLEVFKYYQQIKELQALNRELALALERAIGYSEHLWNANGRIYNFEDKLKYLKETLKKSKGGNGMKYNKESFLDHRPGCARGGPVHHWGYRV
jgi:hypothetical protein